MSTVEQFVKGSCTNVQKQEAAACPLLACECACSRAQPGKNAPRKQCKLMTVSMRGQRVLARTDRTVRSQRKQKACAAPVDLQRQRAGEAEPRSEVPEADGGVLGGRDEHVARGVGDGGADGQLVAVQRLERHAARNVEHANRRVVAACTPETGKLWETWKSRGNVELEGRDGRTERLKERGRRAWAAVLVDDCASGWLCVVQVGGCAWHEGAYVRVDGCAPASRSVHTHAGECIRLCSRVLVCSYACGS
eukprot:5802969-Pleurochrysis_carterae.AAC.1